jgi:hypothetical protein
MFPVKSIYLLPGRGGRLNKGLGAELLARGFSITGRELVDEFRALPFREQVAIVANDLKSSHWREDALLIANSFGAYLFLHAQAELPPYVGRVLLLSPIVGEASNEESMMFFVPPGARRLHERITSGTFPMPTRCEIHVGELDWQSNPEQVRAIGRLLRVPVFVIPNNGHALDRNYVADLLGNWLP